MTRDPSPELKLRRVVTEADFESAKTLIRAYAESLRETVCLASHEEEMAHLAEHYPTSQGGLWLAFWEGRIAGCVALRQRRPEQAEIKRLYVNPGDRGRGIARQLMLTVLHAAAAHGYTSAYLDTLPSMSAAQALYRTLGFQITRPSPHPDVPLEMERTLP